MITTYQRPRAARRITKSPPTSSPNANAIDIDIVIDSARRNKSPTPPTKKPHRPHPCKRYTTKQETGQKVSVSMPEGTGASFCATGGYARYVYGTFLYNTSQGFAGDNQTHLHKPKGVASGTRWERRRWISLRDIEDPSHLPIFLIWDDKVSADITVSTGGFHTIRERVC